MIESHALYSVGFFNSKCKCLAKWYDTAEKFFFIMSNLFTLSQALSNISVQRIYYGYNIPKILIEQ